MPVLFFNPQNQKPARKGRAVFSGVLLNPGNNELTDEQFQVIKELSQYKELVSSQVLKTQTAKRGRPKKEVTEDADSGIPS